MMIIIIIIIIIIMISIDFGPGADQHRAIPRHFRQIQHQTCDDDQFLFILQKKMIPAKSQPVVWLMCVEWKVH